MKKMMLFPVVLLLMTLLVSACAAGSSGASATQTAESVASVNADTPLSSRLAIGTLLLEDTGLAVTAEQAKTLLPLWKAVKSMSSSDTATEAEIQAIYNQIQESMSAGQIAAIEAMEMTQDEMTSLMSRLGIEPGGFGGAGMANLTEDQRATQIAQFQAQGGMPAGDLPSGDLPSSGEFSAPSGGGSGRPSGGGGSAPSGGAGGMPSGGSGGFVGGGNFPSGDAAGMDPAMLGATQTTPGAVTTRRTNGMNQMFVEPLINLLTERSAS